MPPCARHHLPHDPAAGSVRTLARPILPRLVGAAVAEGDAVLEAELAHGAGVEDDLVVAERNSSAERVPVLSLVLGEVLAQVGRRLALGLQDVRRDGAGVLVDDHECVAVPIDAYHTLGRPEVVVRRASEASGQWPAGAAPRVVLGVRLQRGVVEALVAVHLGEVWHAVRDLAEVL